MTPQERQDVIRAKEHCARLFLTTAVLLVVDAVIVVLAVEPLRSVALVGLGWLLSGLWKYQRMYEHIVRQLG